MIERISLRRMSATVGFADVRLAGVNLRDLKIEQSVGGGLTFTPPAHTDNKGRTWPAYALQPGARETIERAIAAQWGRNQS